jgi:2-polyprenyl-6-methoxyphenol hydroxylase-like FAD-dependent oxidoreductase
VRIACVGAGPAGLCFAVLMKLRDPGHDITIFERNAADLTYGWGVVFGGDLIEKLHSLDPWLAQEIEQAAFHWVNQVVEIEGTAVAAGGHGYAINRQRLLAILTERAQGLGVRIEFGHGVADSSQLPAADLLVACDGVNSRVRREAGVFQTDVHVGSNKYIWLGTDKVFRSFTFPFVATSHGWVWAHTYGIDAGSSTFIVECSSKTWAGLGFDALPPQDGLSLLEKLFEHQLDGHRLIGQSGDGAISQWLNFRTISNRRWHAGSTVLAGDAAHTAHFTIGSGTKLAVEDAIALDENLARHGRLEPALRSYERQRRAELTQAQTDARHSAQWFENIPRYISLRPDQFALLLHARRSPVLPYLPSRLSYRLGRATGGVAGLRGLHRRVEPKARAVYSRIRQV